jgi:8-oxo-dGTP diphosphatase
MALPRDGEMGLRNVEVVVGIVLRGYEFLVERRGTDEKVDPGIVCLPGGHVNVGEDRETALRREMREELGIEVKKATFVCRNLHVASNGERQDAYCYLIEDFDGEPVCRAAEEIFWEVDPENLSLEVDKRTIAKLKELGLRKRVS